MDNSTENVTLFAVFIKDILKNYEDNKSDYTELFKMTEGYDLSNPYNKVPMKLYNDLCQWIENNLGKFNLIRVGRNIGETVFTNLVTNKIISEKATPIEIVQALAKIANEMVQDPKGRGWVILKHEENKIFMKRTQTFNSKLQIGLLDGLVRKSGVFSVNVDYVKSLEKGDDFDEYMISWAS
jgi:hypothetical protein